MNKRWPQDFVLATVMGFACPLFAEETLSAEQLVALLRASATRYHSIEATMEGRGFQYASSAKDNPVEKYYIEMDYRRSADRIFAQVLSTYDRNTPQSRSLRTTYGVANSVGRLLREEPVGATWFHAQIMSKKDLLGQLSYTPDMLIKDRVFDGGERTISQMCRGSVTRDPSSSCWILDFPLVADNPKSPQHRITLDPEKDFFPIRQEIRLADQKVILIDECSGFRKFEGLWFPMSFSWMDPQSCFGGRYEYKSVAINEPISPDRLQVEFPPNAAVDDMIHGVEYKIGANRVSGGSQTAAPSDAVPHPGPILAAPAGDDDLAKAAARADEMLKKPKVASKTPIRIDLAPDFVWVLPGKNQYTLELASDSKTRPALSGKSISKSPLILGQVEDQVSASGKLIVTLERPEGHKAFADAVLTLDFAGTKVPIHFVAAPLP
jgi:hypothetical protein